MDVDFMRKVDRYIGVPLCLLFSVFDSIARIFRRRPKRIKKILFLQISEMGSTISAYSAIKKVKTMYPDAKFYYLIFKEMQESIHLLNVISKENVFTITQKSFFGFIIDTIKVIFQIRKEKVDAVIDLELFSRFSALLGYMLGAPVRVGFFRYHMEGLYRGSFQTHKVIYNHLKHISHNFLSLVYALHQDPCDTPLSKIKIDEKDIIIKKVKAKEDRVDRIFQKLKRENNSINRKSTIIIINPNASQLLPLRRWPIEHYITLTKMILQDPSTFVVITGIKSEEYDAGKICNAVKDKRCINLAGKTSLTELIDLYHASRLLISNDSGPPNFATLTDIHVLVLFGPETPVCYKPLGNNVQALYAQYMCSPCVSAYNHRKSTCQDNKCLQAITPEEVYKSVTKIIS